MKNKVLRTTAITALTIYLISFLTGVLGTALAFLLSHLGILTLDRLWVIPLLPIVTCVLLGTLLSQTAGRRFVRFVERLNEALKQIAKGNYEITLEGTPPVQEIREIISNFNVMTRELSATEMLRSDFIENVSHEFKTPLAAIEGYAALLQQPDLTEENRREYTDKIIAATRRLNGLSENILLLSRLEHQESLPETESFSLDEQIRENILLTEPIWSKKGIELTVDLEDCTFRGNRELLAQVWQNIFGNAVKFAPAGGVISVSLCCSLDHIAVRFSDNGPGMTEAERKRAFEKFYQADRSRSSSGNGLGLALAKRIVDLHGGNVEIKSQPNRGSEFIILLPQMKKHL
jgi:signal transduction histidine kinase